MKEPITNVGLVCDRHEPKPNPKFKEVPPVVFIGRFVKKAFKGKDPRGQERVEHMWVAIRKVDNGELVGTLDNDPICEMEIDYGDTVRVRLEEVEAVEPPIPEH